MGRYSKGGFIPGSVTVRFIPDVSPDGNGRSDVVFANECIISRDQVCTRRDQFHANAPHASIRADRWWRCPLHDNAVS